MCSMKVLLQMICCNNFIILLFRLLGTRQQCCFGYCRRMACGDLSFTAFCFCVFLFVGHTVNEINDVWQQISHTRCQKGTKFDTLIDRTLLYIISKTGELWPKGSPWGAKIHKWVRNVTRFSYRYVVWSSAVQFGTMTLVNFSTICLVS